MVSHVFSPFQVFLILHKALPHTRALCRIKVLPLTHVLVDTWMLTVKPVYKLLNVSDDLKRTTNTHVTPFSLTFKAYLIISKILEDLFFAPLFFTRPPYFYPFIFVFTCPNNRWTGLYIKPCLTLIILMNV